MLSLFGLVWLKPTRCQLLIRQHLLVACWPIPHWIIELQEYDFHYHIGCVSHKKNGALYFSIVVDPLTLSTTRAISLGYAFYPTNVHVNEVCNRVALQAYSTFIGIVVSRIALTIHRCVSISYLLIEDLTKETRGSSPPDHCVFQ